VNAAGIDFDLFRLARDQDAYAAGMSAVPEGSRLLALTFDSRLTSKNTWSLHHASGLYVLERSTSAQDVWADSPTMPLRFRDRPDFFHDELQVERFVESTETRSGFCGEQAFRGLAGDCDDIWRKQWAWLWREAGTHVDRVLLFAPTADALSTVPAGWRRLLERGRLVVLQPPAEPLPLARP
jgi:hypothetical protein